MIYIALAAEGGWLKPNPMVAARVIRAAGRGLALMHDDPAAAKAAVRSFFPETEAALFDASWNSQAGSFPRTPRLAEADVAITMAFAGQMNERPLALQPGQIFTNAYVDLAESPR